MKTQQAEGQSTGEERREEPIMFIDLADDRDDDSSDGEVAIVGCGSVAPDGSVENVAAAAGEGSSAAQPAGQSVFNDASEQHLGGKQDSNSAAARPLHDNTHPPRKQNSSGGEEASLLTESPSPPLEADKPVQFRRLIKREAGASLKPKASVESKLAQQNKRKKSKNEDDHELKSLTGDDGSVQTDAHSVPMSFSQNIGSRVIEISIPTHEEIAQCHGGTPPSYTASSEKIASPDDLWCMMAPPMSKKNRKRLQMGLEPQPLKLIVNIRQPLEPVVKAYHQVEYPPGQELPPPPEELSNLPFRHVLFSKAAAHARINASASLSESEAEQQEKKEEEGSEAEGDSDSYGEEEYQSDTDQPVLKEWFPHDPEEFILNPVEIELAWLGEESMHCLNTNDFQWDFIYEYASPALKVKLRGLRDDDDSKKMAGLVRHWDPLVTGRFEVVREHIWGLLRSGFRRLQMKRIIAELRLLKRNVQNGGKRSFPPLDLKAVASQSYTYTTDEKHQGKKQKAK
jgi:hypothetical protein